MQPKTELDYSRNPDLLQHRAGNLALWNLSCRYFAIVSASILAAVLAKPELPKTVQIRGFSLSEVILSYLMIGVIGLFFAEIGYVILSLTKSEREIPEIVKRLFVLYTMLGFCIFYWLLSAMLK
jgi:hypothetical protein